MMKLRTFFRLDRWRIALPGLGPVVRGYGIARFCRILGTLLHNGVPILQSLKIARDSAGNKILQEQIDVATESVRKGESLALHYRRAPELGTSVLAFAARMLEQLRPGFSLQPGDQVVELKSRLFSKGSAVQDFLREPPFAARAPLAIGDDFTDVDAFRVVEYLGGLSIAVGSRIRGRERLQNPAQVHDFLADLVDELGRHAGATATAPARHGLAS